MIQTAHTTRSRPVAAHRRSLTGSLAREARAVRVWHTTKATGDDDRAVPGGLLAGGLKNALGFFKARMDEMMEDEEEALVTRVVQRSRDDDSVASWSIDLSVFLREPTTPLSAKAAARVERVSLGMECEFAERDAGVYPSRGGAGVRGSRYFVDDGLGKDAEDGWAQQPFFKTNPGHSVAVRPGTPSNMYSPAVAWGRTGYGDAAPPEIPPNSNNAPDFMPPGGFVWCFMIHVQQKLATASKGSHTHTHSGGR